MTRSARNKTLILTDADKQRLRSRIYYKPPPEGFSERLEGIACGSWTQWLPALPPESIDLLFLDPPYNMDKIFGSRKFSARSVKEYTQYIREILCNFVHYLSPTATVYICGDWKSSNSIYEAASEFFHVRNRITWEREKGRGALTNWKANSEDIWFCTVSKTYTFNVKDVKMRRNVLTPYKDKDWAETSQGKFRDTFPSNLWTDITVPFWSMSENTGHPTQKSEKLLAKLILASTNPGDYIVDPFHGSGTTAAVAQKLGRKCFGIDIDDEYCHWAAHRLERPDTRIQGYDGVFYERNTKVK